MRYVGGSRGFRDEDRFERCPVCTPGAGFWVQRLVPEVVQEEAESLLQRGQMLKVAAGTIHAVQAAGSEILALVYQRGLPPQTSLRHCSSRCSDFQIHVSCPCTVQVARGLFSLVFLVRYQDASVCGCGQSLLTRQIRHRRYPAETQLQAPG